MEQARGLRDMMHKRKNTPIQIITVTSAKGGVGKTSVAVNMAIALQKLHRRVLLVDMDVGLSNVDLMLGLQTKYSLADLLYGGKDIDDIIETGPMGVQFISGGAGLTELIDIQPQQMHGIIGKLLCLEDVADTIIFDTASGISEYIVRLMCASHITWLVTTPEPTAIMDAYALVKRASREHLYPQIQLLLNRAETEKEAVAAMDGFIKIAAKNMDITIEKLGYIPYDTHAIDAIKRQEPLLLCYPDSPAAQSLYMLAKRFCESSGRRKAGLSIFLERLMGKMTTVGGEK